jgi:hypothetical protein
MITYLTGPGAGNSICSIDKDQPKEIIGQLAYVFSKAADEIVEKTSSESEDWRS